MSAFTLASLAAWLLVVVLAYALRSRAYAVFRGVSLGLHVLFTSVLVSHFPPAVFPLFVALHGTVFVSSLALVRPRPRGFAYRWLVNVPAAFFAAGTLLALPWVVVAAFGHALPWPWLPYAFSLVGTLQSLTSRRETVDVLANGLSHAPAAIGADLPTRVPASVPENERVPNPLRLVQITDPHLGPFMSARRLRRITERAVAQQPDLVLLTGDFLTMESQAHPELLAHAFAPLAALPGRVFACFGNHDHEAPATVRTALASAGVGLLVDAAVTVQTAAGSVEVLGFDFVWKNRGEHLAGVCARFPRSDGVFRLALLHDPSAFRHLPAGAADLVLSGHTHGGQVGLVSLGLSWTLLRVFSKSPDHGLWARGSDRLYVHRGTGHYGFPLRLGVPAEESLLRVHGRRSGG